MSQVITTMVAFGAVSMVFFAALAIESRSASDRRTLWHAARFNLTYYVATVVLLWPVQAFLAPTLVSLVNSAGAGFIRLSSAGWSAAAGVLALLIATDLLEYGYHRAQHMIPLLWRFHSFHHSEERLNATTAMRQHWIDALIRSLVIYPLVGLIFRADATLIFAVRVLTILNNAQVHMGTRRDGGRLWWLLSSPQYHRCHHSIEPHCIGKNIAAMFPIWDVIFGTCYKPTPNEYGPTGLTPSVRPTLAGAIVWPFGVTARLS